MNDHRENNHNSEIPIAQLYTEAAQTFRHYSQASRTIRLSSIIQGLVILGGAGYLVNTKQFEAGLIVSLFGLLFTLFLFSLHDGYYFVCESFQKSILRLEEKAGITDLGPFTFYEKEREQIINNRLTRTLRSHSTFTLVGIAFVCLILRCGYHLIS